MLSAAGAAAKSALRKSGVEKRNEYQFFSVIAIFLVSFHDRDTRDAYSIQPRKPKNTRPQLDQPRIWLIVLPPSSPLKIEGTTLAYVTKINDPLAMLM